jgi:HTH-type transcriptional regulator/antitoxin HigA
LKGTSAVNKYILIPAVTVIPGNIIQMELEVHDWSQEDLAKIMGCPVKTLNAIIKVKKLITPKTTIEFGKGFGTPSDI